jgi:hypothetical protein
MQATVRLNAGSNAKLAGEERGEAANNNSNNKNNGRAGPRQVLGSKFGSDHDNSGGNSPDSSVPHVDLPGINPHHPCHGMTPITNNLRDAHAPWRPASVQAPR